MIAKLILKSPVTRCQAGKCVNQTISLPLSIKEANVNLSVCARSTPLSAPLTCPNRLGVHDLLYTVALPTGDTTHSEMALQASTFLYMYSWYTNVG